MYLAQAIEYSVQTGRALSILFEWIFPLTRFIAFESGIDCRVFIAVAVNAVLLLIPTCPATFVLLCSVTGAPRRHRCAALFLVFGIQLAGLYEHPAFSVGVIGWFIGGAVNLTRAIEYVVQTGRARTVSFEWLLPLTGFRASESGVDRRILGVVVVVSSLVSAVPWLAIIVPDI